MLHPALHPRCRCLCRCRRPQLGCLHVIDMQPRARATLLRTDPRLLMTDAENTLLPTIEYLQVQRRCRSHCPMQLWQPQPLSCAAGRWRPAHCLHGHCLHGHQSVLLRVGLPDARPSTDGTATAADASVAAAAAANCRAWA